MTTIGQVDYAVNKVVSKMKLPWYLRLRESPPWGCVLIALTLLIAYSVTYRSGGTMTASPHLFYVPVILGAFLHHHWGGLVVGIIAGVLCGPLMPSHTELAIAQTVDNWLMRALFFTLIGVLTGGLTRSLTNQIEALRTVNAETVLAFVRAVDAKDPYTADHSVRVSQYATAIAKQMGLREADVDRIRWAALLHDLGKLAIPEEILRKSSGLSEAEWELIRRHPIKSAEIVDGIESYRDYIPGIRQHHERPDGKGYPEGLRGDDLCLDARIIAVADAFEAMTSDRPYRGALTPDAALDRIRQCAGSQFDAEVVDALERALAHSPERFAARSSL